MKYLLAYDLGTSGNKTTLLDTEGRLVKSAVNHTKPIISTATGLDFPHPRSPVIITNFDAITPGVHVLCT